MKTHSIKEIKQLLETHDVTTDILAQLKVDQRKGVQQLLRSYEKQQLKMKRLADRFAMMQHFDEQYKKKNKFLIAGVDEAGRGPLAGPVVAASVILPDDFKLLGLTDSKQLTETERESYYKHITEQAIDYHIAVIDAEVIDQINILNATKKAMIQALINLKHAPSLALIDAVNLENLPFPTEAIIKGDEKSTVIAAASILAKVTRDHIMQTHDEAYPMYGFQQHKGYGTQVHITALKTHGISPIHRTSFGPVQQIINQ